MCTSYGIEKKTDFAINCKNLLTVKEFKCQKSHKISNFYLLPKLYKSEGFNKIMHETNS